MDCKGIKFHYLVNVIYSFKIYIFQQNNNLQEKLVFSLQIVKISPTKSYFCYSFTIG